MDRQATLSSLIQFDAPLADLEDGLATIGWGEEPVVTLTRRHIDAVLRRFSSGEIDADAVETWANLIECRDDIQFDPSHDEIILQAIHDLANPLLQGRLENILSDVLSTLRDEI